MTAVVLSKSAFYTITRKVSVPKNVQEVALRGGIYPKKENCEPGFLNSFRCLLNLSLIMIIRPKSNRRLLIVGNQIRLSTSFKFFAGEGVK